MNEHLPITREAPPPDDWNAYRRYLYLLAKLLFFLAIGGICWLVLDSVGGVLSMLFVSLLLAYTLDPLVDWFEAHRVSRTLAIVILMAGTLLFAAGFFLWIIPTLVREFGDAGERVQRWVGSDHADLALWATDTFGVNVDELMADAQEKAREVLPAALAYVGEFLKGALARTMGAIGWLLNIVMVPIFVFYFLRDFEHMKATVVDLLPLHRRDAVVSRARRVDAVVGAWLRGQVKVALILSVLYAVGLALTGVKLGVAIGLIAGLLNIVPYLGFAFGLGLATMMAILEWAGWGTLAGVVAVFTLVHALEGYVLTPRIVGEKVGLSPVAVIIVLLVGGELFGLLGFLLAVPVAGALKTVLIEVLDWYRASKHYRGDSASL